MPIVDLVPTDLAAPIGVPQGFAVTPGENDLSDNAPGFGSVVSAAFRQDNTVGAYLSSDDRDMPSFKEDGFNPWDAIKGTKYEGRADSFWDVRNSRAAELRKMQIDREEADRKIIDAAPWYQSLPAQMMAGVVDWPTLLPGGAFVRGANGGISVTRSALMVGTAAGASTAVQEAALQDIQTTRSGTESAINIGAGVLLGGVLGWGGAKLLSRAEWKAAESAIEADMGRPAAVSAASKPVYDDVFGQLRAAGFDEGEAATNAAVFAARYATRAERLGEGATPFDVYKGDGLEVNRVSEPPADLAASLGVFGDDLAARSFNQDEVQRAIKAYHGSPHDFDRFDSSKIGTGEGAQAYGHGLYFAENEATARAYREALAGKDTLPVRNAQLAEIAKELRQYEVPGAHGKYNDPRGYELKALYNQIMDERAADKGRMYEVAIKADPAKFLDWDKPLARQGSAIKSVVNELGRKTNDYGHSAFSSLANDSSSLDKAIGADIYRAIPWGGDKTKATEILREAGIPGIKYLDQGSRGAGKGSSNYVIFDDTLVDIVRKYQMAETGVDARGRITVYKDNSAVIDLFKTADKSTFMHESGHLWLGEMVRDAAKSTAIKSDLDQLLKWFDVDDASKIGLKEHEQFARGFEEYLREGKAPSAALAKAFDQFRQWLTTIYRSLVDLGPDRVAMPDDVRAVMDRMLATDAEIAVLRGAPTWRAQSMGAAANTATDLAENSIAGRAASGLASATARLNPLLRILHSPSPMSREVGTQLFENPLYLKKNFDGVASEAAVETFMKEWNGGLAKAIGSNKAAFAEYVKANGGGVLERNIGSMATRSGLMTRSEFNERVSQAMRRGDNDPDPFVAKAAQEYRANVFEPLKNAAIEAKLLPPDVSVDTAQSYLTRMWNSRAISADQHGFKEMVMDWVQQKAPEWEQQFDRTAQRRLDPLIREIDELETAKLRRGEELKQRIDVADTSEMSEADIRQAIRIVNGKAPRPKGVKTLSQFVLEAGGLVDDAGELAHRGITNKARPGLIRKERRTAQNKGGWTLDDMARHAWENEYFPHHSQRPSIDEFVEAMNDDFHKIRAVLKNGDEDAYALTDYIARLEADLSRAGVGADNKARFSTSEEMKGAVDRVYKAMDAEADSKIAVLRDRLKERETDIRVDRESRFVGDPKELGRSIADEVFDTLTGRSGDGPVPNFITIKARGPLKERTFNIPDLFTGSNGRSVEGYLENDVEHIARRYTRVMGADVELSRKFGSVDMADQIRRIREDYARLSSRVTEKKELLKLTDRENADIRDIEAVRDMLRGTNPGSPAEENYSRFVRSVNHFNYLRSMGEVAIASLTEVVRPAMVHGLTPYMETLGQTLSNMKGIKLSVDEAQLAGNVVERVLGTRLATLSEIVDPYASRGPMEAFLENMTNVASKWNGIRLLTDMQKSIASVMTQNRLLEGVSRFAEAPAKEKAYLAYVGIDQSMAERIAAQFSSHGETVEKVRVANTEKWTDDVARRAYRAAINKDVDSIITTKGVADTPLFANTPTGRAMLQFKSFALSSHQRVLLRGLQEDQSRFLGGLIAMTTIGMMTTWLKAQTGNRPERLQDVSKNPGWWIAEGLDKSGIMAVPMELSNMFEKGTGLNPIKAPVKAFDEGSAISQKNQNRSLLGSLVGPTAGLIDDGSSILNVPQKVIAGEEVTKGQKNAAERLLPFNSYAGVRQLLRYVLNPAN